MKDHSRPETKGVLPETIIAVYFLLRYYRHHYSCV